MARERWALGATPREDGVRFRLWAPEKARVEVAIEGGATRPLERGPRGVFEALVPEASAGDRYRYLIDGAPTPDPASRFQPEGVHGPSEVIDPGRYAWNDASWGGVPRRDLVFYELHVGTFTPQGTFDGVRGRLPYLRDLGVTAIELMPVHDFPGRWNWGYDPAAFWAPARCYGGPEDLRALVDEAHALGLAVYLDVVYNHMGPDGAYVAGTAPFFNPRHQTSWGPAVNLDGEGSEGVRAFFRENALHWLEEYHVDGLRLDATFALVDDSPVHFLTELSEEVAALPGPPRLLVAEDHRNERRLLEPRAEGGHGLDAVWSDDFHHLVRRLATGDRHSYYRPYPASPTAIGRAAEQGWYLTGEPHGTDPGGLDKDRFVVCIQNHDQVGNRPRGDRLHHAIERPLYRALSSLLLFCPELPLLFMGQEWGVSSPFLYFTDHNEELGRAVSRGRKREFRHFPGFSGEVPDPQAEETFRRSLLRWEEREEAPHAGALRLYRDLLARRRELEGDVEMIDASDRSLVLRRGRRKLAVAFEAGVEVEIGESHELWNSEQAAYSEAPAPPVAEDGIARFQVASALLLEEPA